jgi:hypothetical protein
MCAGIPADADDRALIRAGAGVSDSATKAFKSAIGTHRWDRATDPPIV